MAQSGGRRSGFGTLLIVLIGQMGCLTLIVIALSVAAGVWLDDVFHTRPILTVGLLLAGVPVSIFLMLFVARRSLEKFRPGNDGTEKQEKESL